MRPSAKLGSTIRKVLCSAALTLALALPAGAREQSADIGRGQTPACVNNFTSNPVSTPVVPESPAQGNRREVTSYVLDSEGDHSLDVATVVEQAFSGYASYTVQLHLASGAEQSIAVTAPPGGLQLEMHDMTGDKVPNDLVLRPSLIHWLPTVLLNDGHDHFEVAISNHRPDSLSCGQDLESRESDARGTLALMSSGFKVGGLTRGRELFPQFKELLLAPTSQAIFRRWDRITSSGRAPPVRLTSI